MATQGEIKSEKIFVKEVFREWFCIPEYQRPYVWGYDEIHDLLDDLTYAQEEKRESEYFLGSFVFQSKPKEKATDGNYPENDLLDGQQRMTTLLLLFAVIRDLSGDKSTKDSCRKYIYQEEDRIENVPGRNRITYKTKKAVDEFFNQFIKTENMTLERDKLKEIKKNGNDISVRNMANAILEISNFFSESEWFEEKDDQKLTDLLSFIATRVLMIYVATEDLEDAFRMFMILNDRGVPLRNSDILKSMNLGALQEEEEKIKYAKMWEEAEGELGDDLDRFLSHIRTILVKEKARLNLLKEFEDKIYNPKEKDKSTGKKKPVLLNKGKDTFEFISKYLDHYNTLFSGNNHDHIKSFKFDNLIQVMLRGLPATDWEPPLLKYFDRFEFQNLLEFLEKLDNKFSADIIAQYSPTDRIEAMNNVIKEIEKAGSPSEVITSDCFDIDVGSFLRVLDGPIYRKRFARYILLKLDYYYAQHVQKMQFSTLTVEHILPQTPSDESQWVKDFTSEQREDLTDRIGNLVMITRNKNSSQGRKDYVQKKENYFKGNIDTCPNSLRVMNNYSKWTPIELRENQNTVISKIKEKYGIQSSI